MTTAAAIVDARPRADECTLLDRFVLWYATLWVVFLIGGFRLPWEPISLDEDETFSFRRQVVFTLGGLLAVHRLVQSGRLQLRINLHLPWVAFSLLLIGSLAWTTDQSLTLKRSLVHAFGVILLLATVDAHPQPVRFFIRTTSLALGSVALIALA